MFEDPSLRHSLAQQTSLLITLLRGTIRSGLKTTNKTTSDYLSVILLARCRYKVYSSYCFLTLNGQNHKQPFKLSRTIYAQMANRNFQPILSIFQTFTSVSS